MWAAMDENPMPRLLSAMGKLNPSLDRMYLLSRMREDALPM